MKLKNGGEAERWRGCLYSGLQIGSLTRCCSLISPAGKELSIFNRGKGDIRVNSGQWVVRKEDGTISIVNEGDPLLTPVDGPSSET